MNAPSKRALPVHKLVSLAVGITFVAAIWAPLAALVFGNDVDATGAENRKAADFPALSLSIESLGRFPSRFEDFFQDHFPFRQALMQTSNVVKVMAFGVSPVPKAIIGRDSWLFYTELPLDVERKGMAPFAQHDLQRWGAIHQKRHDDLVAMGAHYLFVVAPDKQTIYRDYMPHAYRNTKRGPSRLDQLYGYLQKHTSVPCLDLRPVLAEGRKKERVYHRTDAHWNDVGSFLGYEAIAQKIHEWVPRITPMHREQLNAYSRLGTGDVARMLGVSDFWPKEPMGPNEGWVKRQRATWTMSVEGVTSLEHDYLAIQPMSARVENGEPGCLLVLGDSFSTPLALLLGEHFERTVMVPTFQMPRTLVRRERPTIVVQEMVERSLNHDNVINDIVKE
jgi:hypothetical protein